MLKHIKRFKFKSTEYVSNTLLIKVSINSYFNWNNFVRHCFQSNSFTEKENIKTILRLETQ